QEAHTALGDIRTSAAVLSAQLSRYEHLPRDLSGLQAYCDEFSPFQTAVDRWFEDTGEGLIFRRGKHRGRALEDVAREETDYLTWMLGADDMDAEVVAVVRNALKAVGD
ncbi:MAG: hypothetical protein RLN75_02590, partial [Longimicrobiales bacterium]